MRGCDILIGTPGRLADIVTTRPEALSLIRLKYTIFDEADELMDPDWEDGMAPMITGATAHHNEVSQSSTPVSTILCSLLIFLKNSVAPIHDVLCNFQPRGARGRSKVSRAGVH